MERLIASEWRTYAGQVIPPNAPAVQITESRRAFYAGAHALLTTLLKSLEPGTEPTEADLALMDRVKDELDQFQRDVQAGVA